MRETSDYPANTNIPEKVRIAMEEFQPQEGESKRLWNRRVNQRLSLLPIDEKEQCIS